MNKLQQWMQSRTAPKRRGPKLPGLSYAETARELTAQLRTQENHITKTMVYDWIKGRSQIPKDVLNYINEVVE